MRTLNLDYLDADRTRRVRLAACACGLSSAEFIRGAVDIAVQSMAAKDPYLAMMIAGQSRKSDDR
jgi:hypothetical protein